MTTLLGDLNKTTKKAFTDYIRQPISWRLHYMELHETVELIVHLLPMKICNSVVAFGGHDYPAGLRMFHELH